MRQQNPATKCLDKCNTPEALVWAKNHKGSKMIFELTPHPDGKWILELQEDGSYEASLAGDAYEGDTFICHWDICENREQKDSKPSSAPAGRRGAAAPAPAQAAAPTTGRRAAPAQPVTQRTAPAADLNGGIEASVIVAGITYYGILMPLEGATTNTKPASDLEDL